MHLLNVFQKDSTKRSTTDATIEANNAKLVPIVTLSKNDNIKFLKNVKQGRI